MKQLPLLFIAACLVFSASADDPEARLSDFIRYRVKTGSNPAYGIETDLQRKSLDLRERKALTEFLHRRNYSTRPELLLEDARTLVRFAEGALTEIETEIPVYQDFLSRTASPGLRHAYLPRYVQPHVFLDVLKETVLTDSVLKRLPANPLNLYSSRTLSDLVSELRGFSLNLAKRTEKLGRVLTEPEWKTGLAQLLVSTRAMEKKVNDSREEIGEIAKKAVSASGPGGRIETVTRPSRTLSEVPNSYRALQSALEDLTPDPHQARAKGDISHALRRLTVSLFFDELETDWVSIQPELFQSAFGGPLERWAYQDDKGNWMANSLSGARPDFRDWAVIQLDRLLRSEFSPGKRNELVELHLKSLGIDWDRYAEKVSDTFQNFGLSRFFPAFEANKNLIFQFQSELSSADLLTDFRRLALLDLLTITPSGEASARYLSALPSHQLRKSLLFLWNSGDTLARARMVQLFRETLGEGARNDGLKAMQGLATLMNDRTAAAELFDEVARKLGARLSQRPEVQVQLRGLLQYVFQEGGTRTACPVWLN